MRSLFRCVFGMLACWVLALPSHEGALIRSRIEDLLPLTPGEGNGEAKALSMVQLVDERQRSRFRTASLGSMFSQAAASKAPNDNVGMNALTASLARCKTAVAHARDVLSHATSVSPDDVPQVLENWCGSQLDSVQELKAMRMGHLVVLVWKKACSTARSEMEDVMMQGSAEGTAAIEPEKYCATLKDGLFSHFKNETDSKWWSFAQKTTTYLPYTPSVATPEKQLDYLKVPNPCCRAHDTPGGGCFDKVIEECVCKRDRACCTQRANGTEEVEVPGNWDITCAEQVEKLYETFSLQHGNVMERCGRCPGDDYTADTSTVEATQRSATESAIMTKPQDPLASDANTLSAEVSPTPPGANATKR